MKKVKKITKITKPEPTEAPETPKDSGVTIPEFNPRLVSSDSTGRLVWNLGNKEESWYIDAMNVDEVLRTSRHRPKEAYNKAKKWRLNV